MYTTCMRFKISVIIFVSYILPVVQVALIDEEFHQQVYRQIQKGYRLTSDYIKSNHSVVSLFECGIFCLQEQCSGFNYKDKKENNEINCQLANLRASLHLITTDESWDIYVNKYGSKEFSGKSCHDILKNHYEYVQDGIYWISLASTDSTAFPVFCDMKNGGWTLVFKAVDDVPGTLSNVWQSQSTFEENSLEALNVNSTFKNHYKNRIIQKWDTFNPTQARVALYSQGEEDLALTFNAQNTDNLNWFTEANLETSPWQDIHTITDKNYFSLVGACDNPQEGCRNFYINHHHGGCEVDTGWLCIGNSKGCDWEIRHGESSFLYSKTSTTTNWHAGDVGASDVFAVYLR